MTMVEYNSKIIRFDDHIEIIRYGENRIRSASEHNNSKRVLKRIDFDKETQNQRAFEQAYRIKRKIKYYCQANDFDLFWTLTLNDNKVNARNYEYSRKRLQAWLKYQREKYGKFNFLFLPELHPSSGRIHFHGVTGGLSPPLVEARYPKSERLIKKNGIQIYNAENWHNGFSTVSKIQDRQKSASYITKYITKELIEMPSAFYQPRYFVSRGLKQPEISYDELSDNYFRDFKPSFVVGERNLLDNEFETDVSIYRIDISEEGELIQNSLPETVWKIREIKSLDGNQDFQK
ncbi:hypothetical protein EFK34_09955 [Lactococcus lactis subsp. lactis]|nr:hypothetical protein [Lactococcus lactis]MCT0061671.1 hypothetical protein [Lactococcus lactis subsp. lactis]MCT0137657.1 hypothetical protein [Lactococcus lactis subsp. lactis]